jgi:hypothetical protein
MRHTNSSSRVHRFIAHLIMFFNIIDQAMSANMRQQRGGRMCRRAVVQIIEGV